MKNYSSPHDGFRYLERKSEYSDTLPSKKSNNGGFFALIVGILLIFNFVSLARGSENVFTFSGLLNFLPSIGQIPFDMNILNLSIIADWGIFNFLRDLFNLFASFFTFGIFISTSLLNMLIYLLNIIAYIFGVVS